MCFSAPEATKHKKNNRLNLSVKALEIEEEKKVKMTQQAVNKRKIKCFSILREKLEKYDLDF